MKHLVLIDGHHLMHRAFWAVPRTLKTRAGELTNVSFGVASMLLSILSKEEPDALVVCFDAGNETFRHQENETYKDGRSETPDEFYTQIPRVFELINSFGFASVEDPQYEADDFLGSYAKAAEAAGMRVTIVTGDHDIWQLATDKIRVAIPHKGYQQAEYLGPEEIETKSGVRPDQVASYKGLCGDASDNLPGVMGIGPKTAARLLQQYQTLQGIYDHLDNIKGNVQEKLRKDKEQAFFCEHMAELVCDIPLPHSLEDIQLKELDPVPALTFFQDLEFTLLVKRFQNFLTMDYGKTLFKTDAIPASFDIVPKKDSQLSMF